MKKIRLDKLIVEKGLAESREKAKAYVLAGKVIVGHHRVDKPGTLVLPTAEVRIKGNLCPYVSRGGLKLKAAIDAFSLVFQGGVGLDLGASTGGFTDCMLQHGAETIYALDVGYGQLHMKLRQDERVVNIERCNARHVTKSQLNVPDSFYFDFVVTDVSFISVRLLLETVSVMLAEGGFFLCLVKPQFEAGKDHVGKGGVVSDDSVRNRCVEQVVEAAKLHGLVMEQRMDCPIHGPKGNREILVLFRKLVQ